MKIKLILLLLAATTMGALSESNNMFVILTAPQFKANWLSGFKKDRSGKIIPSLETILATLKRIKADGFSSSKNLIDETSIRTIMDKGYEYHVWTVDDARTATRFKQWGAKSITTNVPGSMRGSLSKTKATEKLPWVKP